MRITLVSETFAPEINGVAMTWSHLVIGLIRLGHELAVIRPRQRPNDSGGQFPGLREVLVQGSPIPGYPQLRFGWPDIPVLRRELRRQKPDLVHIVTEGPLGWAAWWVAHRLGIPITSSYHTHFQHYTKHYGAGFLKQLALGYLKAFHNRTLCTFGPTAELNRELAADGFLNLRILSRGVDTELFSPKWRDPALRSSWGATDDNPVVIHSSRIAAEKNYPVLLRCYSRIRAARPDTIFIIIGDGPLRQKLQAENPQVRFTGFLPRRDLARHLASADLYVHASETETFGNVVTEAMASGLAVAGYDYAAAAQYLRDGDNGRVAPLGDEQRLADLSAELARDLVTARQLGRAARSAAELVSWERVILGFERDLKEFAAKPQPVCLEEEAAVSELT